MQENSQKKLAILIGGSDRFSGLRGISRDTSSTRHHLKAAINTLNQIFDGGHAEIINLS